VLSCALSHGSVTGRLLLPVLNCGRHLPLMLSCALSHASVTGRSLLLVFNCGRHLPLMLSCALSHALVTGRSLLPVLNCGKVSVQLLQHDIQLREFNPLDSKSNYSAASNDRMLVRCQLMGGLLHLVQQGGAWAGCSPAQSPPRCTKCNSPPINGQCTNHCIAI